LRRFAKLRHLAHVEGLSGSRMMTKRVPTLPMPWMKSRRTALPKSGGGSICSGAMSITSLTASTSSPSSTRSSEVPPFGTASKITMQVFLPSRTAPAEAGCSFDRHRP